MSAPLTPTSLQEVASVCFSTRLSSLRARLRPQSFPPLRVRSRQVLHSVRLGIREWLADPFAKRAPRREQGVSLPRA